CLLASFPATRTRIFFPPGWSSRLGRKLDIVFSFLFVNERGGIQAGHVIDVTVNYNPYSILLGVMFGQLCLTDSFRHNFFIPTNTMEGKFCIPAFQGLSRFSSQSAIYTLFD